jgi:hypothetical protein
MRATLIVAFCLCAIAGTVLAQTAPPSSSQGPAAKKGKAKSGETTDKAPTEADGKGTFNWYADCLKLWEPATHMSRKEWDRACRRQAQLQKEIDDMSGLGKK